MSASDINDTTEVSLNELLSGSVNVPLRHAKIGSDCKGIESMSDIAKIYGLNVTVHNIFNDDVC